jgi:hypothetical protein
MSKLELLKGRLRSDPNCEVIRGLNIRMMMKKKRSEHEVRKKLQKFVDAIRCPADESGTGVTIQFLKTEVFNRKRWENVTFNPKDGVHIRPAASRKAEPLIMRVVKKETLMRMAAIAKQLIKSLPCDNSRTVRHIYYLVSGSESSDCILINLFLCDPNDRRNTFYAIRCIPVI